MNFARFAFFFAFSRSRAPESHESSFPRLRVGGGGGAWEVGLDVYEEEGLLVVDFFFTSRLPGRRDALSFICFVGPEDKNNVGDGGVGDSV